MILVMDRFAVLFRRILEGEGLCKPHYFFNSAILSSNSVFGRKETVIENVVLVH